MYEVYTILETNNGRNKSFWVRIGVAFTNKDGSINVKLNCLPLNGTLHLREKNRNDSKEPR